MNLSEIFTRGGAKIPRLFFGCAEAEGEADNRRMPLLEVYEDYQHISEQIVHEKFILIGRKGSGKSAYGTFICEYAKSSANIFAKFVRRHDYDLELITRSAQEAGIEFNPASFIKWLALTQVIKLFLQSEAVKESKKYYLLDSFLRKNSGYVEIDRSNVVGEIKRYEFKVSTELFRRFLTSAYGKSLDIKEERAHYTRLLPHLESTVQEILRSRLVEDNDNSFYLFFDDLDLDHYGDEKSKLALVELLRTIKSINLDTFSGGRAKIIVLLRDDIALQLGNFADTGKIIDTYGYPISWIRERELRQIAENEILLKKMINKRIAFAFRYAGVPCQVDDPWQSLVSYRAESSSKSTFREVLEYTLFRPRDLIVFFSPLNESDYTLPLGYAEMRKLREQYEKSLYVELSNEISATFSKKQSDSIFRILSQVKNGESYSDFLASIKEEMPDSDATVIAEFLYSRSMIGNIDERGHYWFSCRSPAGAKGHDLDKRQAITVQIALRNYLSTYK